MIITANGVRFEIVPGANLHGADLSGANLFGVKAGHGTDFTGATV